MVLIIPVQRFRRLYSPTDINTIWSQVTALDSTSTLNEDRKDRIISHHFIDMLGIFEVSAIGED